MTLRPKETKLLRDALGLTGRTKIADRYGKHVFGHDVEAWQNLVKLGYAVEHKPGHTPLSRYFFVTIAGFEAVKSGREKLGPMAAEKMEEAVRGRAAQ